MNSISSMNEFLKEYTHVTGLMFKIGEQREYAQVIIYPEAIILNGDEAVSPSKVINRMTEFVDKLKTGSFYTDLENEISELNTKVEKLKIEIEKRDYTIKILMEMKEDKNQVGVGVNS